MKLSPPKQITFYIAVILWLLGLINMLMAGGPLAAIPGIAWFAVLGGLLLILGCALDGL